jgi:hypothetical protein
MRLALRQLLIFTAVADTGSNHRGGASRCHSRPPAAPLIELESRVFG